MQAIQRQDPSDADTLHKFALAMNAIGRDEEALQSIEQAYELDDTYNPEYRELLMAWDEDSWEDQFEEEDSGATEVQKVVRGCWGRLKGRDIMAKERELRRRKRVAATHFQRLWRGVLGRIFVEEEKVRWERYKELVSLSLKRMEGRVKLFGLRLLHRRVQAIHREREKSRKVYEEEMIRRNIKRMKQRRILSAYLAWYNNVQEIIEERIRFRNHSSSSIALWCKFIHWRIERRERERKVRWALTRMQARWKEEGFWAWHEFKVFSICIKIQRRRSAYRTKRRMFADWCRFKLWNIERKIRLEEKRRLREIRFRNDVRELLGLHEPLYVEPTALPRSHEDAAQVQRWAEVMNEKERRLRRKAADCEQSLGFAGRLALQSGTLRALIPRFPRPGESQVSVLEREMQIGGGSLEADHRAPAKLPALPHVLAMDAMDFDESFHEHKAAPASVLEQIWPKNAKAERVSKLTGAGLHELKVLRPGLSMSASAVAAAAFGLDDFSAAARREEEGKEAAAIHGLYTLPYGVCDDMLDSTSRKQEAAGRRARAAAARLKANGADDALREQHGMFAAEKDDRRRDAILTDQERSRDLARFKKCVAVAGPLDQGLFCSTLLPGRIFSQIVFKAACRVQMFMLVAVPSRRVRRELAAGLIQNCWFDYLDRKHAKRELYLRRVVRKMGAARLERNFTSWRCEARKVKRLRHLVNRRLKARQLHLLLKWRETVRSIKRHRRRLLENAARRIRMRQVEGFFDKWAEFAEKSKRLKQFVWERMKRETIIWFDLWFNAVFAAKIARREKEAAISIQRVARGMLGRISADEKWERDTAAALMLQRALRGRFARVAFQQMRALARRKMQKLARRKERSARYDKRNAERREKMAERREQILAELRSMRQQGLEEEKAGVGDEGEGEGKAREGERGGRGGGGDDDGGGAPAREERKEGGGVAE